MFHLTDEQLILLDGHADDKLQAEINEAKKRLEIKKNLGVGDTPDYIQAFVSDVVVRTQSCGILQYHWKMVHFCPICKKAAGYFKFKRTSRYHKKGDDDYKHPDSWVGQAYWWAPLRDSINVCPSCDKLAKPILRLALADVQAELPEELTGQPTEYFRSEHIGCKKCGWIGHRLQMKRQMTLMGDGWVHIECPKCGAGRNLFDRNYDYLPGFTLVHRSEINPKTKCVDWKES